MQALEDLACLIVELRWLEDLRAGFGSWSESKNEEVIGRERWRNGECDI